MLIAILLIFVYGGPTGIPAQLLQTALVGVHWELIPDVIIYQSSVPLIIETKWNEPTATEKGLNVRIPEDLSWKPLAEAMNNSHVSWRHVLDQLEEQYLNLFPEPLIMSRSRRAVPILGEILHWCCGVLTDARAHPLFANQRMLHRVLEKYQIKADADHDVLQKTITALQKYTTALKSVLDTERCHVVNLTRIVKQLYDNLDTEKMDEEIKFNFIWDVLTTLTQETRDLLRITAKGQTIEACRDRKIPATILPPERLAAQLVALQSAVRLNGYRLTIPIEEVSRYYHLNIATCAVVADKLHLIIKIPLVSKTAHWQLYRITCAPFAWENQTCTLCDERHIAIASPERTIFIRESKLENCDSEKLGLCYVPRASLSEKYELCLSQFAADSPISKLIESCPMTCLPNSGPQILQLNEQHFVLTHLRQTTRFECAEGDVFFTEQLPATPSVGAMEMIIPCNCRLISNESNHLLVDAVFPCDAKSAQQFEVVHIVPAVWSSLTTLHLPAYTPHIPTRFSNVSEILNFNWTQQVPRLNLPIVTADRHSRVPPLQPFPESGMVDRIESFVLAVITVIVVVIIGRNPALLLASLPGARAEVFLPKTVIEHSVQFIWVLVLIALIAMTIVHFCRVLLRFFRLPVISRWLNRSAAPQEGTCRGCRNLAAPAAAEAAEAV